jgi:hypothetical protein
MIVELLELVSVTVISVKEAVSEKAVTDCVGRVSTSETVVEECVDEGSYVESVMESLPGCVGVFHRKREKKLFEVDLRLISCVIRIWRASSTDLNQHCR